ncbi:dihydrodipicolinate synthase family protein [Streptomyces sp. NBC_01210]|uniref:dihydrodipicolinate synthase family protein n=1 Tax=Streptomyces sp. NBC_01210 TaxID=2903774 RepID=UPI002E10DC8A|nr:dihydrodipicolinate synthase family protein [Streptomyces sp. NBC_01210]
MTIRLLHGVYEPRTEPAVFAAGGAPLISRTVFSAAHVVADPYADTSWGSPAAVDWDATLAFRRHLWSHGLGVAEAMDTAQRGMGLDWAGAAELIRRSAAEAKAVGGRIACGVGTDQLTAGAGPLASGAGSSAGAGPLASGAGSSADTGSSASGAPSLAEVRDAYEEQLALVEESGAQAIVMASRALASAARTSDDYLAVYSHLLRQASEPVILHWLGPMFDPALEGYWGSADLDAATSVLLDVISAHPDKVDGIKISLLDAQREIDLRRRLPEGVRCYTGDDFNYPELIAGDEHGFSHALLGIFDPLGPSAAEAVRVLDTGDVSGFRKRLDPTVALSRHLFQPPTRFYKTGVVLLAWLAGHQSHFTMVGGLQSARSLPHFCRAYELADGLGLFPDPVLAESRMKSLLSMYGVAQ